MYDVLNSDTMRFGKTNAYLTTDRYYNDYNSVFVTDDGCQSSHTCTTN